MQKSLKTHNQKIIKCIKCPRLVKYIKNISKPKRFREQDYWSKPLPGFGDVYAKILIVGLAPAAHGGNRTGRMFTGDSSGDWVAKTLYQNGFANKKTSTEKDDGFYLKNAYITAVVRCAPPQNKPLPEELSNCLEYLNEELKILQNIKIIVCLGRIAFAQLCKTLEIKGEKFSHGHTFSWNNFKIICSYHPSRQNTQTGRLSWNDWNMIFKKAKKMSDLSN